MRAIVSGPDQQTKKDHIQVKVGIIGLGSIGQKHALCLNELGVTDIHALRTHKGSKEKDPKLNFIQEHNDPSGFFSIPFDCFIISNPSSEHYGSIVKCHETNRKALIFVEKPMVNTLEAAQNLTSMNSDRIMVGYCLRYHPIIKIVKNLLDTNRIGNVLKSHLYCGQLLTTWHPYTDYSSEYYSSQKLGGGALRTLSHEIDLMLYFFGDVVELSATIDKISSLKIDVEDNVSLLCRSENNVLVSVDLDYLNPNSERWGTIIGEKGMIRYDFGRSTVSIIEANGTMIPFFDGSKDPEDMYLNQMSDLINVIDREQSVPCNFADGLSVLNIISHAERSNDQRSWIKL